MHHRTTCNWTWRCRWRSRSRPGTTPQRTARGRCRRFPRPQSATRPQLPRRSSTRFSGHPPCPCSRTCAPRRRQTASRTSRSGTGRPPSTFRRTRSPRCRRPSLPNRGPQKRPDASAPTPPRPNPHTRAAARWQEPAHGAERTEAWWRPHNQLICGRTSCTYFDDACHAKYPRSALWRWCGAPACRRHSAAGTYRARHFRRGILFPSRPWRRNKNIEYHSSAC